MIRKRKNTKTPRRTTLDLSEEQYAALVAEAERTSAPLSVVMRRALAVFLRLKDISEKEQHLEVVDSKGSRTRIEFIIV